MAARGFTFEMLQDLVRAGLATAKREAISGAEAKIVHLRITDTGRRAITA
jgi:hypothetical protein